MPLTLSSPIDSIKGVGETNAAKLRGIGVETIRDLLLLLPLKYQDRSQRATFATAIPGETYTFLATVESASQYYKGRKSIQRAVFLDESGKMNALWFNNKFIIPTLKKDGQHFLVSGSINDKKMLVQPTVEKYQEGIESIHTDRIVPLYTQRTKIPVGTLRRILKKLLESHAELLTKEDWVVQEKVTESYPDIPTLYDTLQSLHFPNTEEAVISARKRLALEELCSLIQHSRTLKAQWNRQISSCQIPANELSTISIPKTIPFTLTQEQTNSIQDIFEDLSKPQPMNRLLVGDVGSGKTIVAGMAALALIKAKQSVAFIAPTQILAQQHFETLKTFFPDLNIVLVVGGSRTKKKTTNAVAQHQTLLVGTHSILNSLKESRPALLIFDEQHRFGVGHRSEHLAVLDYIPHVLTMTATPIPRSYMLTIFNHLHLSTIQTLPPGRKTTKTWLVSEEKRLASYEWIADHITEHGSQIIQVCPFINPSSEEAFQDIAAATQRFTEISAHLKKTHPHLRVGLLHGKLPQKEKDSITKNIYNTEIDWLITTPVVEVGLDLPKADIIVIEGSERFGLASLHQLRGRVGRGGQQGFCLLFTSKAAHHKKERLSYFTQQPNGFTLAEYDLQNRGGGNLFGSEQHGQDGLRYADWADLDVISKARAIYDTFLEQNKNWQSLVPRVEKNKDLIVQNTTKLPRTQTKKKQIAGN